MNNNIPQFSKITPLITRNAALSSPEDTRWQTEVAPKHKTARIIEERQFVLEWNYFPATLLASMFFSKFII